MGMDEVGNELFAELEDELLLSKYDHLSRGGANKTENFSYDFNVKVFGLYGLVQKKSFQFMRTDTTNRYN